MGFLMLVQLAALPSLSVSAVIDILLLAFIIYYILQMLKGTQAPQILLGMALLVALYYGARWGELQTVAWLMDQVLPFLVFAFIVLFAVEIRNALAKIGRNPFRTDFSSLVVQQASEDIVMAASQFSSQKTGALIVLERDTGLRTYTESGISLQAQLSYDLLVAIFQPRAPLHDGAVILRKDKIVAAACFLPLSVNPIFGAELGTRHRAAVGITEETDAVAVVVSEETGSISLATGGSIELNLSAEQLAERLSQIFQQPVSRATPLASHAPTLERTPSAPTRSA